MSEWHAWHDDDWQSEVLDDDGNYYRDGDTLDLPDTVNRGAAGQRLDMEHGFLRHIVSRTMCFILVFATSLLTCPLNVVFWFIATTSEGTPDVRGSKPVR